ncbi:MAG TPA: DUF305 domain-containing protein [Microbacteriaceae bacterium]|jgi:uncharacterized protein (DUF305 family)|nr:DUF305 domain-containing protein [Microbacteriaceae bacterium]
MHPAKSPSNRVGAGTGRVALIVTALVTAVVVGVVAFSAGRLSTLGDASPADTSAEAGFARDMQVHHDQGVELAMIVRDRTDDPEVRLLAYDIALTQKQQSGQLYGWLTQWGLSQAAPEPSMTWMTRPGLAGTATGHTHDAALTPGERMPGLATPAQIAALTAASGVDAERIFLTLMIAHHQGALEMAEAALDRSSNSAVRGFANAVITSQTSEIDVMKSMLAHRA